MSVVEEIRTGMCGKKIQYDSHDEAQIAYWEMCSKRADCDRLVYYQCEFCGYWHLGNERPGMDKRIALIREAKGERKNSTVVAEDRSERVQQQCPEGHLHLR